MVSKEARQTLQIAWPLLFGIALIMAGVGLQGTLLSLRANVEGFPLYATGIIMSTYYMGFLIGCRSAAKLIASVGHIRVFAGFASLASTTILAHGIFVDPWAWGAIRFIGGIGFAGLFVVAESWLNSVTPNKLRGQVFTSYIFVLHGGLFIGQFFIGLASIDQIELFILISILVSLSLLPITLANKPTPGYSEPETLPFKDLFARSALAPAAVLCAGLTGATFLTLGPIYAQEASFSASQIAFFIGCFVVGAGTLPLGIGALSDRMDRRKIIVAIAITALCCSLFIANSSAFWAISVFLLGGLITSLYGVAIAFVNDYIRPEQVTSASASLILLNGVGSCIGPFVTGFLVQWYGVDALFYVLSVAFGLTSLLGVYRIFTGRVIDIAKQKVFRPVPVRSAFLVMQMRRKQKTTKPPA